MNLKELYNSSVESKSEKLDITFVTEIYPFLIKTLPKYFNTKIDYPLLPFTREGKERKEVFKILEKYFGRHQEWSSGGEGGFYINEELVDDIEKYYKKSYKKYNKN